MIFVNNVKYFYLIKKRKNVKALNALQIFVEFIYKKFVLHVKVLQLFKKFCMI